MKFTTTLASLILGLTSTSSALPTGDQTIIPTTISIYHGYNGAIEYDVARGKASRLQSGNDDISTLITFTFPESTRYKKCEFKFELDDTYPPYTFSPANAAVDVFRTSKIATGDSAGWGPPSNYRDTQVGRLRLKAGDQAVVDWQVGAGFTFDCPAGETWGFEVTPTGDAMSVEWGEPTDGPWIRWW